MIKSFLSRGFAPTERFRRKATIISRKSKQPSTENNFDDLETLWAALLSRQPEHILAAFQALSTEEQEAVLVHLKRMAEEYGWHPQQRVSARAALQVLKSYH